ncbi:hypothetical protein MKX01_003122 [Papaver californicum]|nr:hypothetical protein MKX01_003122 [Papaver californicum]
MLHPETEVQLKLLMAETKEEMELQWFYSKTWYSYSSEVMSLFKRLGEPLVIELDEMGPQGPQLQKVLERLTGQHTVPNVFIGGKHIGGCTDTVKLQRKGELESLLSEAKSQSTRI